MFDPTGVLCGDLGIDAKGSEPAGKQCVPFVDLVGNFFSFIGQGNISQIIYQNVTVGPEIFHGHAYAGFGDGQLLRNINGTDIAEPGM